MSCCINPIVLGCYNHCGELSGGEMVVILPIDATETGTHIVEVDHLGSTIASFFEATTGQPFEIPHIFNEFSKPTIRILMPSGSYFEAKIDVLTTNISTTLSDCFTLAISPSFETTPEGSTDISLLSMGHSFPGLNGHSLNAIYLDPVPGGVYNGNYRFYVSNNGTEPVDGLVLIIQKPDTRFYVTTIDPDRIISDGVFDGSQTVHNPDFDIVDYGNIYVCTYKKAVPVGSTVVQLAVAVDIITGLPDLNIPKGELTGHILGNSSESSGRIFFVLPDLKVDIDLDDPTGDIQTGTSVDGIIDISNIGGDMEIEDAFNVGFFITKPDQAKFTMNILAGTTVVDVDGGTQVDNALFAVADAGSFFFVTWNKAWPIFYDATRKIGFTMTAIGAIGEESDLLVSLGPTTEYDSSNNSPSQTFTITA